ncbi:MAG: histidine phosphatase family protein, partial [Bryobacteraceae bacterium]
MRISLTLRNRRGSLPAAFFAAIAIPWIAYMLPAATVILVRHAERASGMTADALLNAQGEARARRLAEALRDAGVRAIYTTEVRRTQQTAAPLAEWLHLKPIVIAQKDVEGLV